MARAGAIKSTLFSVAAAKVGAVLAGGTLLRAFGAVKSFGEAFALAIGDVGTMFAKAKALGTVGAATTGLGILAGAFAAGAIGLSLVEKLWPDKDKKHEEAREHTRALHTYTITGGVVGSVAASAAALALTAAAPSAAFIALAGFAGGIIGNVAGFRKADSEEMREKYGIKPKSNGIISRTLRTVEDVVLGPEHIKPT